MNDNPIAGRVRLLLGRTSIDSATAVYPVIPVRAQSSAPEPEETSPSVPSSAGKSAQPPLAVPPNEALQVLTLAQRTAQEYVDAANEHARAVGDEAEKNAEYSRKDAQAYAERVRAEADKVLTTTRAAAETTGREALTEAAEIRRQAEQLLTDARAEADRIVADGNAAADQMELRAQRRYEDAVGTLSTKREALQEQIEILEIFDAEYRHRLMSFLQGQLRALWSGRPQPFDLPDAEPQMPGGPK